MLIKNNLYTGLNKEGDKLKTVSRKITVVLTISLFVSFLITNGLMYYSVYNKTLESAGIEAYGCANITTGLIDLTELKKAINGDKEAMAGIGEGIDWTIDHKDIFDAQYILDLDGKIIAADKNLLAEGVKLGDEHQLNKGLIKHIVDMNHPTYSKIYESNGEKTLTGLAPIYEDHDPSKKVIAISAIDFDASVVTERTIDTIKTSVFGGALPLLLVLVVTYLFVKRIVRPIKVVSDKVNEVSKGDLTVEIDVNSNDEIGLLAKDFNSLVKRFRNILGDVSFNTTQLAATSEELFASSQNISEISNQNTNRIDEVKTMSDVQSQHMLEINGIIQELSEHIQTISQQLYNFSTISQQTVDQAALGEEVIGKTNVQMQNIDGKIEKLTETIISLQSKSKEINQIIQLINDISEQTSILSFNATIEAERAGQSGKGFAVVASEVRKLAEESTNSTKEINELLNQIQKEINDALTESEEGRIEAKEGINKVKEAGESFHDISLRIKEVSKDLATSSTSVESVSNEIEEIVEKMEEVLQLLDNTTNNTTDVSNAINDQNDSFKEIVMVTDTLSKLSEELKNKIEYFKI